MPRFLLQFNPAAGPQLLQQLQALAVPLVSPRPLFDYFVVELPAMLAAQLSSLPGVLKIEADKRMGILPFPVNQELQGVLTGGPLGLPNPLGLVGAMALRPGTWPTGESRKVVGADVADADGITGKGVKVAVLDTGTDPSHPMLLGNTGESTINTQPLAWDENGHGCIEGDAMVFTTFCGLVKLADLFERIPGPAVWEREGWIKRCPGGISTIGFGEGPQWTAVTAVHKIPCGEAVEVYAGTSRFITSCAHPFLVYDRPKRKYRYVRADSLKVNSSRKHGLYGLALCSKTLKFPFKPTVDTNTAYLAGLYIAEGTPSRGEVQLSLHEREAPIIASWLKSLGFSCGVCHAKIGKEARVLVYGDLSRQLVQTVTDRTIIPEMLLKQPVENLAALLAGLIDGDGHFDTNRPRFRLVTAEEGLAHQLVNILSALGFDGRITSQLPTGKGRKICWTVSIGGQDFPRFVSFIKPYLHLKHPRTMTSRKRHPYLLIKSVAPVPYAGHLYDLTTCTHNYLAGARGMTFIHNTHVASTVAGASFSHPQGRLQGVAPGAELIIIKVLGAGIGLGDWSDILAGMQRAAELGAKILSLSLGGDDNADPEASERRVVHQLTERGIICCIAAGNSGSKAQTIGSPGSAADALTIGAINKAGQVADFSSRGKTLLNLVKPDATAPGVDILSGSTGIIAAYRFLDGLGRFAAISGTSMSTPAASGCIALAEEYAQRRGGTLTTAAVKQALARYYNREPDNNVGYGLITYPILKQYIDAAF